jgi:hypothetical protein
MTVHLPSPTIWPFVLGSGVALLLFGLLTSYLLSVLGVVLVALALAGWIGELVEPHEHD